MARMPIERFIPISCEWANTRGPDAVVPEVSAGISILVVHSTTLIHQ